LDPLNERAARALAQVAEEYRRDGFDVLIAPRNTSLPEFLREFEPELVATSENKGNFVVEVKAGGRPKPSAWTQLAQVVESQSGWHFRVLILADDDEPVVAYDSGWAQDIAVRLDEARALLRQGYANASLLLAWGVFEAAARQHLLEADMAPRALAPQALLKHLVHAGILNQDSLPTLSSIARQRNAAAHGFHAEISRDDVRTLLDAGAELLRSAVARQTPEI
jgi:hypothetical protein